MKRNRFPGGPLLLVCLVFSLAGCSFDEPAYETPTGVTLEVYPNLVLVSWAPVSGANGYNVRLNGNLLTSPPITTAYYVELGTPPARGSRYTVTAVYDDGGEGYPSNTVVVGDVVPLPPAPADEDQTSKNWLVAEVVPTPATTRPITWGGLATATLSVQGVDYYVFPVNNQADPYYIWWAEAGDVPGLTLDITVTASWYGNNVLIDTADAGYSTYGIRIPANSPGYTGYVVLKVEAQTPPAGGTYYIGYTY
jgi:hypothetical protein